MLNKYISIDKQAEEIDTYEAYKESIELIRNMDYEEIFNIIRDTELALKVLIRGESNADKTYLKCWIETIRNLADIYLKIENSSSDLEYTYEYVEKKEKEKQPDNKIQES